MAQKRYMFFFSPAGQRVWPARLAVVVRSLWGFFLGWPEGEDRHTDTQTHTDSSLVERTDGTGLEKGEAKGRGGAGDVSASALRCGSCKPAGVSGLVGCWQVGGCAESRLQRSQPASQQPSPLHDASGRRASRTAALYQYWSGTSRSVHSNPNNSRTAHATSAHRQSCIFNKGGRGPFPALDKKEKPGCRRAGSSTGTQQLKTADEGGGGGGSGRAGGHQAPRSQQDQQPRTGGKTYCSISAHLFFLNSNSQPWLHIFSIHPRVRIHSRPVPGKRGGELTSQACRFGEGGG